MKKTVWCVAVFWVICSILLGACDRRIFPTDSNSTDEAKRMFQVHFYDVPETDKKWGDCTYLEFPNGENLLIDIGTAEAGKWIANDLASQGVTHIDYLVFSHFHADHVGGYSALIDKISIGHVYSNGYIAKQMNWIMEDIEKRKIPHTKLTAGDRLSVGDVAADVLWPTADLVTETPTLDVNDPNCVIDTNNRSLLIRFSYGESRLLMTSDLYVRAQNDILAMYEKEELAADVMKVPHHGYDNAVNRNFIEAVSPAYAVMMGNTVMNRVGYQKYAKAGCTTYATWMNGDVWFSFDGEKVEVWADNEDIDKYYR